MKVFVALGMLMLTGTGIACAQSGSRPLSGPAKDTGRSAADSTPRILRAAVVTHRQPLIEQKIDRVVVNVSSLLSNAGATMLDVMANTPGLEVDDDGVVSLKGRTGVQILIDGRPVRLSGSDLAALLRSLPAGSVARLEIMSTPPAGYDAAGTAGIVNIITRKEGAMGLDGSLTGNIATGVYGSSANNVYLHYRGDGLSLNINTGYTVQNSYFRSDRLREYILPDGSPNGSLQQHYMESSNRGGLYGKVDLVYTVAAGTTGSDPTGTEKATGTDRTGMKKTAGMDRARTEWELMAEIYSSPYAERGDYRSRFFNTGGSLDSLQVVNSHLTNRQLTRHLDMSLRQPLGGAGALLTTEWGIVSEGFSQNQLLATAVYAPDNTLLDRDNLSPGQPRHTNVYSGKADYTLPLGKAGRLETGWKSNFMDVDSRAAFSDTFYPASAGTAGGGSDSSWSNNFFYRETVHAFYGSCNKDGQHWSLQAGLRGEYTISRGRVTGGASGRSTGVGGAPGGGGSGGIGGGAGVSGSGGHAGDSSFSRSYAGLFPTLHLSYHPGSGLTHQVLLSAGRRIERPGYWDLNPSVFFFDRSTVYIGNPYLLPELSYEGELSYIYRQHITAAFQYSDTRNMTTRIFRQEGDLFVATPANIGRTRTVELNAGATLSFTSRWTGILYNEWSYSRFHQDQAADPVTGAAADPATRAVAVINPDGQYWRISVNNQFRMERGWSGEISGFYKTGFRSVQNIYRSRWYVNAALQKKCWQDKVVVSLAAKDVFHTRITRLAFNTLPGQKVFFTNELDSRVLSLTVTWRFGTTTTRKASDARSEIDKLKNG